MTRCGEVLINIEANLEGVNFVNIPTTLMHMVDSSTGGKQAVDTRYGKNTLGSFFEPECIFIDHEYLQTLSARHIKNGLAECIKHALCQDKRFFAFIVNKSDKIFEKNFSVCKSIIEKTIAYKRIILDKDSYELNEGMALVYGHTIGHAIESASRYKLSHGEAISIGMVAAAKISQATGIAGKELLEFHNLILNNVGLPARIPKGVLRKDILRFLKYDKKYVDEPLSFVLLSDVGKVYMRDGIVPVAVPKNIAIDVIDSLY